MHEIKDRIREARPAPSAIAEPDVEDLVERARRRTRRTRASIGLGGAATVMLAAVALPSLWGTDPAVQIGGEAAGEASTLFSVEEPPRSPEPSGAPSDRLPPSWSERGPGEILAEPGAGEHAPAASASPAASTCGTDEMPDGVATIVVAPGEPQPRCLQVLPGQQVRLVNEGQRQGDPQDTVEGDLGGYRFHLEPGQEVILPLPASAYLELGGVHEVDIDRTNTPVAEVWVLEHPSASVGHQAALEALIDYARAPSEETFGRLPLAETVLLGTAGHLDEERAVHELRDPEAWQVAGGASAVAELARPLEHPVITSGARPSCEGAPPKEPVEVEGLVRLAVQPAPEPGCDGWFAVDVYLEPADDGMTDVIRAVSIDEAP